MARYIDADKIDFSPLKYDFDRARAKIIIMGQPTADVVEVKHGKWKIFEYESQICASEFVCSVCKESFCSSELTDKQMTEMLKYCPNCGAKMDK